MYLIRLDDASEYMDVEKWKKIEEILDKHEIKPIVGIIPKNEDESMIKNYKYNSEFIQVAKSWQRKNWTIAMHGYDHVYITHEGGINPVQKRSEFAGVPLEKQKEKIRLGIQKMQECGLQPTVFFAPSHTFDENTIKALKEETNIRIMSDTIANDVYFEDDIYFIPQQSGKCRKLPFKIVTFCYHPNEMKVEDFVELEEFIKCNRKKMISVDELSLKTRKKNIIDSLLKKIYFNLRK